MLNHVSTFEISVPVHFPVLHFQRRHQYRCSAAITCIPLTSITINPFHYQLKADCITESVVLFFLHSYLFLLDRANKVVQSLARL